MILAKKAIENINSVSLTGFDHQLNLGDLFNIAFIL